ncbi:MAG: type III pantothenate kinase [Candidatus Omnitrophica bacterium]|nr:type III pantothenate kinase [Candidatus Omnitrophota bacterium]
MILAVDIGNSTIGFGFIRNGKLEGVVKLENMPDSELFRPKLANFLAVAGHRGVQKVIICSVVPDTLKIIRKQILNALQVRPVVVGRDIEVPIVNRYHSPRQVGKDRLVCAFAARELYGFPAVVLDLGTAITFDGISRKGEYLGGAIVPGIRLSAEALFEKTALLPRIIIAPPGHVIGRSTGESIQSGLFYGYGALCDGMVERLAEAMGCRPKIVMTGGYAGVLAKFMKSRVTAVDEELIFKGIGLLAP